MLNEENPPHETHTGDTFEIGVRILGNELFAIVLKSDSMNKKWLGYAILTTFIFMLGIMLFGDSISALTSDIYEAVTPASQTEIISTEPEL